MCFDERNMKKQLTEVSFCLEPICTVCCSGSIRTFDGLNYNYPTKCRHVLAYFHAKTTFTIDWTPAYKCNNLTKACKSAVEIRYGAPSSALFCSNWHSILKKMKSPQPVAKLWFRDLRIRFWGHEIKHLKVHNFVWQGCFFFHYYLATSTTNQLS